MSIAVWEVLNFCHRVFEILVKKKVDISCEELRRLYVERQFTFAEIAKQYNCVPTTICRRLKRCGIPARPPGGSVYEYPKRDFDGTLYEKAYLVGFRIGDLHVEEGNWAIRVRCTSTHQEQIDLVRDLFEKYGGVWISQPREKRGTGITAHLNRSFEFLIPHEDKIEDWILSNSRAFAAFLAGYVDAEGSFASSGSRAYFKVDSGDKGILFQAWARLTEMGIGFPEPRLVRPTGTWIQQFQLSSRRDLWRLTTERKGTLYQFCEMLAPFLRHRKRVRDMEFVRSNVQSRLFKQNTGG